MDTRATVLVVDDDEDIRFATRSVLEEEGYAVQLAANGEEALRCLRSPPQPKLVLLDLRMPEMDGHAFLRELEADPELGRALQRVPVIILSAASDDVTGALPYASLRKPFELAALLEAVAAQLPTARPAPPASGTQETRIGTLWDWEELAS